MSAYDPKRTLPSPLPTYQFDPLRCASSVSGKAMRGRSRAGSAKPRRRKPAGPKRTSGTARPGSSSAVGAESEIARLTHDLNDALERETAASEILKIISSAQAASAQPVLDTVVTNAARLCRAVNATITLREGDFLVFHAQYGPPGLTPRLGTRWPINRRSVSCAAVLDGRTIQVSDLTDSKDYPDSRERAQQLGSRTTLAVPLLRGKTAIGVIVATRREIHPFSKNQIALLQNFAAQAVIAIENTRLLNELRESLEQQTATADVLRIISSSPGELEPVFQAMLANATHICEAKFGILYRCEGDALRTVAMHDAPQPFVEVRRSNPIIRPNPYTTLGRAMTTKQPVQIANILEELDPLDDRAASSQARRRPDCARGPDAQGN
jgi:two-component system, NtrC family, sensor kinase